MKKSNIKILKGTIKEALSVAERITEFENLYPPKEFDKRLKNAKHLILIASYKNKPIGFKIGYETSSKKYFYSWMGGVLKKYRKTDVAQSLMNYQENWAKKHHYDRILLKTRKKHLAMIKLLEKNNYSQMAVLPYQPDEETRILYEKKL